MNQEKPKYLNFFLPLSLFAVAMGLLEDIVVVYMRALFYPEGFDFPLKIMPERITGIEMIRELSTLFMLGVVAWMAGKIFMRRLSAFIFLFGVWDIIYYIALWLFLDWPKSLLTWDILFLVPVTWIGPVLAPLICSVSMIFMAVLFEWLYKQRNKKFLRPVELFLIFAGAFLIFIAFIFDFSSILLKGNYLTQFFSLTKNQNFLNEITSFVPYNFRWEIFITGFISIFSALVLMIKKIPQNNFQHQ